MIPKVAAPTTAAWHPNETSHPDFNPQSYKTSVTTKYGGLKKWSHKLKVPRTWSQHQFTKRHESSGLTRQRILPVRAPN